MNFSALIAYYNGLNMEYIKRFTINEHNCLLCFYKWELIFQSL